MSGFAERADDLRCNATQNGQRCDLAWGHRSYHAARIGDSWREWFDAIGSSQQTSTSQAVQS